MSVAADARQWRASSRESDQSGVEWACPMLTSQFSAPDSPVLASSGLRKVKKRSKKTQVPGSPRGSPGGRLGRRPYARQWGYLATYQIGSVTTYRYKCDRVKWDEPLCARLILEPTPTPKKHIYNHKGQLPACLFETDTSSGSRCPYTSQCGQRNLFG